MGKRLRVGDIIEVKTGKGFAYAQYTHRDKLYGYLVRVLPGFFEHLPIDVQSIANRPSIFVTFLPLQAAVDRKIFSVVENVAIPEKEKAFPLFRAAGLADPSTGKVDQWWLWNGERSWRIDSLTESQRRLPIKGIWNDTLLVERIESDWRPQDDPR
jgi:hypothetical protein